jgi:hypothetical protein
MYSFIETITSQDVLDEVQCNKEHTTQILMETILQWFLYKYKTLLSLTSTPYETNGSKLPLVVKSPKCVSTSSFA